MEHLIRHIFAREVMLHNVNWAGLLGPVLFVLVLAVLPVAFILLATKITKMKREGYPPPALLIAATVAVGLRLLIAMVFYGILRFSQDGDMLEWARGWDYIFTIIFSFVMLGIVGIHVAKALKAGVEVDMFMYVALVLLFVRAITIFGATDSGTVRGLDDRASAGTPVVVAQVSDQVFVIAAEDVAVVYAEAEAAPPVGAPLPIITPPVEIEAPEPAIIEWVNTSPWRMEDHPLTEMPVFRNHFHEAPSDWFGHPGLAYTGLPAYEMERQAQKAADSMGVEDTSTVVRAHDPWATEFIAAEVELTGTYNGVEVSIRVCRRGGIDIFFREGIPLPPGVLLMWQDAALYAHAREFLLGKYGDALGFAPLASDDIIDKILYDEFSRVHFFADHENPTLLRGMWTGPPMARLLEDYVGTFPIISVEEAKVRMMNDYGQFGVDMGQARPELDQVIDVLLRYHGNSLGMFQLDYFAPFYTIVIWRECEWWGDYRHPEFFVVSALADEVLAANPSWGTIPTQ